MVSAIVTPDKSIVISMHVLAVVPELIVILGPSVPPKCFFGNEGVMVIVVLAPVLKAVTEAGVAPWISFLVALIWTLALVRTLPRAWTLPPVRRRWRWRRTFLRVRQ